MAQTARVLVVTPTYNEVGEPRTGHRRRCSRGRPRHPCSSSTTPAPTAPATSPTGSPPAEPRVTRAAPRGASDGLGRAYVAGFAGARRTRLRRRRRDGCRRLAPGGRPARDRSPAARRTHGLVDRLPLDAGRPVVDWPAPPRVAEPRAPTATRASCSGMPVRDVTAGYRAFRARHLHAHPPRALESRGYCFQIDMTLRSSTPGWRIVEVPITFTERWPGDPR